MSSTFLKVEGKLHFPQLNFSLLYIGLVHKSRKIPVTERVDSYQG